MAVLTAAQLADLRKQVEEPSVGFGGNLTKPQINLALQAIEDYFETTARAGIAAAINTATGGNITTGAQKIALVKFWLSSKFNRGG